MSKNAYYTQQQPSVVSEQQADLERLQRLERFSSLMDESIRLPGGFRIGWDGIIGLIPGIGDLFGAGVSAWIIYNSARLGLPRWVVIRMIVNILLEASIGAVPLIGDAFDFVFKANQRNMRLVRKHGLSAGRSSKQVG